MKRTVCSGCQGFGTEPSDCVGAVFVECHACTGNGFIAQPVGQSRAWSLGETCFSTAVGFGIAFATQAAVLPAFGHHVTVAENFWITSIFTVVSVARGYCVRRLFEVWR